jgi:hypothetical protein
MEYTQQQQREESNPALTVFAILGFIALLIAGLWSTIQLVKQGSNMISGTGTRGVTSFMGLTSAGVSMKLDGKNVTPGEAFTVSWSSTKRDDATLTLTYACREHVYLQINANETSYAIPCNAPFTVAQEVTSLSLTAMSEANAPVEIPLTLTLTNASGATSKDASTITVLTPTAAPAPVVEEAPKTQAPVTTTEPAPKKVVEQKQVMVPVKKSDDAGIPDLKPVITQIGVLVDGSLVEKTIFKPGDTVVVRFDVTNHGTKVAKAWTFAAVLPSSPVFTYTSDAQEDLYAGATAHLTMTFDKLASGTGIISISVDAAQAIKEGSEANNGVSRQIVVQ